jgi:hypothetical protein
LVPLEFDSDEYELDTVESESDVEEATGKVIIQYFKIKLISN